MLFSQTIDSIDSEITALLAQVEAKKQRQSQLLELDTLTDNTLGQLGDVVSKIGHYAPEAIASLKTAVLTLFDSGDDGNDGGNHPTDTPPDNNPALSTQQPIPEGQAWDFASSLACLTWEDAPLLGQACTVEVSLAQPEKTTYTEFVKVSDAFGGSRSDHRVGYIRVNTTGEIIATYAGFNNKSRAKSWANYLETMTSRIELRAAKRLGDWKHELKISGLSIKQIERLAAENLDKTPPDKEPSLPPTYKPQPIPQPVNPDEVEPGDIVTALLTPSASYKVIQVMPNGILDCENLTSGDRLGLRPGAVSLVQKANRPTEPEWNAAKYNPVLAAVGAGDDLDF